MYSLGEAAKAAGRAKSTILRDIRRGKLSAARTETGGYQIEPAELARAYPLERSIQRSSNGASNDSQPGPATVEVDRLLDQISDLRETIRDLRDRLDASGAERRHESEEHRRVQERLTGLLTHRQAGSVPPVMPRVRMRGGDGGLTERSKGDEPSTRVTAAVDRAFDRLVHGHQHSPALGSEQLGAQYSVTSRMGVQCV